MQLTTSRRAGINSAMSLIQVFLGKYREILQLSINTTFLFCLIKLIFVIYRTDSNLLISCAQFAVLNIF